ncbi:hypothetical protein CUJ89_22710 [Burkholderia pyrrocinia]|uniref:Uncharacterized protein n=1 Tax=Burkholderia pyrrocinia TaxID=60550 RepID=A0A2Z5N268_BURPY|nr:hypothetical protein CUJ89_22710 [Burkholderia pyrrocinia]
MHATRRRARAFVLRAAPAACIFHSRAIRPRAFVRARLPIARADCPQPTGVQMNSDDSSRLPLAGASLRIDSPTAPRAPASVPPFTDPHPIAPDATRRGAFVRR